MPKTSAAMLKRVLAVLWVIPFAFGADGAPAPCRPPLPSLRRYPMEAMEQKLAGPVIVNFAMSRKGKLESLQLSGDPRLTFDVEWAFRMLTLGQECWGSRGSLKINFLLDPSLATDTPLRLEKLSDNEYSVISPVREVVIIRDPPVVDLSSRPSVFQQMRHWFGKLKFW